MIKRIFVLMILNSLAEAQINTPENDFAPTISANGKIMIFNSVGRGGSMDLFLSIADKDVWSNPVALEGLNSPFTDEAPYLSRDGRYLYFSSDRDGSTEMPKDLKGHIRVSFDLYVSEISDGEFGKPRRLTGLINTSDHEKAPSVSDDGRYLFFTRHPFGAAAKSAIYFSYREGSGWSAPERLSADINAGYSEHAFRPLGNGFVFTSKRPGGKGGFDIYYTENRDGVWSAPESVPGEINSEFNDIFYIRQGGQILFCSDRPGGQGKYDIWLSEGDGIRKIVVTLLDDATNQKIKGAVEIAIAPVQGEPARVAKNTTPEPVEFELHESMSEGTFTFSSPGYLTQVEQKNILKDKEEIVVRLKKLEKGKSFDIHSIHFDYDSAELKEESQPVLEALYRYLAETPQQKIRITGHTDLHGSDSYNDALSLKRAQSVRDYLVGRGIASDRLLTAGAGKRRPVAEGMDPRSDALNRRTQIDLLD